QSNITRITGGCYSIDYNLLDTENKRHIDDMMSGYPAGTYTTPQRLAAVSQPDTTGHIYDWWAPCWDELVVQG
ncbi:MAG: hypothetical protein LBK67_04435, partial [Coriobacteriales bacterium]|nr:hypothetical protein [Coriobacteriales bacterium]